MAYNEFAYFYDEFNGEADYEALYAHIKKELEAQRTEQENFEIVNLVRSMCMSRDELMNFLRGGGNDAPPVETAYHEQEDMTDDEE